MSKTRQTMPYLLGLKICSTHRAVYRKSSLPAGAANMLRVYCDKCFLTGMGMNRTNLRGLRQLVARKNSAPKTAKQQNRLRLPRR